MDEHYEADGSVALHDGEVRYRFNLDLIPVRDGRGTTVGSASVFSYLADLPAAQCAGRPVLFAFNGGPGSASFFLHFSGLGPKRAAVPVDLGRGASPPYPLEDSVCSLLSVADLIFIDPINTGFGRFLPDAEPGDCYSTDGDARYFADLVLDWTTRYDRWDSPKYVLGESYGTIRAPVLANMLLSNAAIPVDGIVLISQAANIQDAWDRPGNAMGAIVNLPTKAVTAWYHGLASKDSSSVDDVFAVALDYAYGDFATAMMKVNLLAQEELATVADRLEQLTGVDASTYIRNRLWLSNRDFCAELFADSGLTVSRYDSRYRSESGKHALCEVMFDPLDLNITPTFASVARRHLHRTFGLPPDRPYLLSDPAGEQWDFTDTTAADYTPLAKPSPFTVYPYPARITQYLRQVPHARLFVGTGYYDTLSTVGVAEHLVRQYDLPLDRVTSRRYPAGHMMYTDPASCEQLAADLRMFLAPSVGR